MLLNKTFHSFDCENTAKAGNSFSFYFVAEPMLLNDGFFIQSFCYYAGNRKNDENKPNGRIGIGINVTALDKNEKPVQNVLECSSSCKRHDYEKDFGIQDIKIHENGKVEVIGVFFCIPKHHKANYFRLKIAVGNFSTVSCPIKVSASRRNPVQKTIQKTVQKKTNINRNESVKPIILNSYDCPSPEPFDINRNYVPTEPKNEALDTLPNEINFEALDSVLFSMNDINQNDLTEPKNEALDTLPNEINFEALDFFVPMDELLNELNVKKMN